MHEAVISPIREGQIAAKALDDWERIQRFFDWRPELVGLYLAPHHRLMVKLAISRLSFLPTSTALSAVNECRKRGYVTREEDVTDARRSFVVATPKLLELVERYIAAERRAQFGDGKSA